MNDGDLDSAVRAIREALIAISRENYDVAGTIGRAYALQRTPRNRVVLLLPLRERGSPFREPDVEASADAVTEAERAG